MSGDNRIIRDFRVLTEDFIPSRIVSRDGQLKAIRDCLKPVLRKLPARNSFLFGVPGTGKTCISQYVLEELKKQYPVMTSYVNCWLSPSRFKILYTILQEFGLFVHRKGVPTDELLDTLAHKIEGKPCVVILDEVDQIEDFRVLYDLLEGGVALVMISNAETALANADPRVRSRLASAENIPFPRYSTKEIAEILKDRKEWGLVPGAVKKQQLDKIAECSEGDARVALKVLANSAQKAEEKNLEKIPDSFIESSFSLAVSHTKERPLEKLSPHQKIIVDIVKEKGSVSSGELFEILEKKSNESGLEEIVDRTFRKHMERLVKSGFVSAKGEGRWREYFLGE